MQTRQVSLVLAGGNALAAYLAGACEALVEADITFDLVSGSSMGAVTTVIFAGNPPEQRIPRLREFWHLAARGGDWWRAPADPWTRDLHNKLNVLDTVTGGRPGLFRPRLSGMASLLPGWPADIGLFDSAPMAATLERLVDFDRLNDGSVPVVLCCVGLVNGEAVHFDSREQRIEVRHVLASTAFVPGFPPVEIDGRLLCDPGVLTNLPLDPVRLAPDPVDRLCFAVDLFDVRGERPHSMDTATERMQDIVFAGQSRRAFDGWRREQGLRHEVAADAPDVEVVYAAYRARPSEVAGKMLEFSATSIEERWKRGRDDMQSALGAWNTGRASVVAPGFKLFDGLSADHASAPRPALADAAPVAAGHGEERADTVGVPS